MHEQRKIVTETPENSETPLENVRSWVTPTRLFFVRNHSEPPEIDVENWRLSVEGLVDNALSLSWDDLMELPERTVFATVECAGNGRSFLRPKAHGVQWGSGAVGHAEWTGVPLHLVLEKAGVKSGAVEVLFEGADLGQEADQSEPMHFTRSLPMDKALSPDTLLVFRMNGELLEPNHGYPLRLFVPGWYGVAAVKWLARIEVIDYQYRGYFQSKKYTIKRETPEGQETVVVGPMQVKSEILRPHTGDKLGIGMNRIFGVAWAGEEAISRVEISTDNGESWTEASLIGPQSPYSWSLFEYLWEVAESGDYTLLSRAVSESGRTQPMQHDPLCGGYHIHHVRPIEVMVEGEKRSDDQHADASTLVYDMNAFAEENTRLPLDVEMSFEEGAGI